ncbi:unnamed protein product [Prunus armeniaca]
MPSRDGSKASSSQVPLYLWGGSVVYKKRFVANLHHVTNEDQFHRWRAAYASAIPDDVYVKLAKPLTDNMPCVDANDPNARIITFRPFTSPWASNSRCRSSSRRCFAPWGVLRANVLPMFIGRSCASRI